MSQGSIAANDNPGAAHEAPQRLLLSRILTPTGMALLVCDERGLVRALDWEGYEARMQLLLRRHYGHGALVSDIADGAAPAQVADAIDAYFAGELTALDAIPIATHGTPFQRRVWAELRRIPPGQTLSYAQLRDRIGAPAGATRAVGQANGANPVGVITPCHRVIAADGGLGGYAAGLARKTWLLTHEGARFRREASHAAMPTLQQFAFQL